MTKFLTLVLNAVVWALTCWLPRWKRLTVRARMHDQMLPFEDVICGDKTIRLHIPDRTSVYWAKVGPDSEPMTNTWIQSIGEDGVLVDIGANIGLYSLMAAAHGVGRVYAFEPNPFSFAILSRNIISNGFNNQITAACIALNETTSPVSFQLGGLNAGGIHNEITSEASSHTNLSTTTPAFSIDDLFNAQGISGISHLKIDVDGLELNILRGADAFLSNPTLSSLLVEDDSVNDQGVSEIATLLAGYGFTLSSQFQDDGLQNKVFTRTA